MARGYYLYNTAEWDLASVDALSPAANTADGAEPPDTVLFGKLAERYVTNLIGPNTTTVLVFTTSSIQVDTLIIPGMLLLGEEVALSADWVYRRPLITKPTGTVQLRAGNSLLTPQDPSSDSSIVFLPETYTDNSRITNRMGEVQIWRGYAAITVPKTTGSSWRVSIQINASARYLLVIPRVMAGVRYTPEINFIDDPSNFIRDPLRLGAGAGADSNSPRLSPYDEFSITYNNLEDNDYETLRDLVRYSGKTNPIGIVPVPERSSSISYVRMLDSGGNWTSRNSERGYSSFTLNMQEVSRV